MTEFVTGQRWICDSELDLGLGTVLESDFRTVKIIYLASGETRNYAKQSAPLRRAAFDIGDVIESQDGLQLTIEKVIHQNGLLSYIGISHDGASQQLGEEQLSHNIQLNRPYDRLFSGQIDENKWFQLRVESLSHQQKLQNSQLTGLYDARTSLIPHQLFIAHEVAKRFAPRVLLADEVGLGKTIEACLIMQHQLITGRAKRVLIVVPDALLHQWLVELLRRFNLRFSIFDEDRCEAIESSSDFSNPFEAEQLVLCNLSFLVSHKKRLTQAVEGLWDLIIVDEAHHLEWQENSPSDAYQAVAQLSTKCKGLLLLTATPEQLGKSSHFARLRLLDPQRFHNYQTFLEEEQHYQSLVDTIDAILDGSTLSEEKIQELVNWISNNETSDLISEIESSLRNTTILTTKEKQRLTNLLLDRHGTGRILYRNSRRMIKGFPTRTVYTHALDLPKEYRQLYEMASHLELDSASLNLIPERLFCIVGKLKSALNTNLTNANWWQFDSRADFLIDFLDKRKNEKILVICASSETVKDLEKAIRSKSSNRIATFHEDLTIIERDRAANYFADPDDGAQALICSEIGSEGRNFQFSHQLVLFDLPLNPDLLEQRIGRLDRIGQTQDIQIHVPYFQNSPQDIMLQWYNNGLNAFTTTCQVGDAIFSKVEPALLELLFDNEINSESLATLIKSTQQLLKEYNEALEKGRDRLLELNSCKPDIAEALKTEISDIDQDVSLQKYMERAFDAYGVDMEEHKHHSFFIKPGPQMQSSIFHGLNEDGNVITYHRDTALANENMQFITWNHPYVNDAIDLILASESGNTSVVALKTRKFSPGSILVETIFVPEIIFPEARSSGIAVTQDHLHFGFNAQAKKLSNDILKQIAFSQFDSIDEETATTIIKTQDHIIKPILSHAEKSANSLLPQIIEENSARLAQQIGDELDRLISLKKINPNIREEEIEHYRTLLYLSQQRLAASKIRLDAIRVIITH